MGKENDKDALNDSASSGSSSPIKTHSSRGSTASRLSDGDLGLPACRVCQCVESDEGGEAVLGILGIIPPTPESHSTEDDSKMSPKDVSPDLVQFVSPDGEVFVCHVDLEMGASHNKNTLIELGCSCKNELALVHYACALKWFLNHGSTICEICGHVASNIRSEDVRKVFASLKDYLALRGMTVNGIPNPVQICDNSGVDPDAVAAVQRQRLSEIFLWFNPQGHTRHCDNYDSSNVATASLVVGEQPPEQPSGIVVGNGVTRFESPAARWAVEGTGILLATGLLTVTLAWLIAPRVGKKTAKSGLHILLGGVCALAVVVFFRVIVLTRIRYGPARYWAILFVFWFLLFGIWASRTHAAHAT